MTYVEKLQAWVDDQRANHGLVDIKFFPNYMVIPGMDPIKIFPGPDPTIEQAAEAAYKILTGEIESHPLDVSEL